MMKSMVGGAGFLRGCAALALLFAAAPVSCLADDNVGPQIYRAEAPGTLLIRASGVKSDDRMDSQVGTGFVIDAAGHVLTASHVVPDGRYKTLIIGGSLGPETASAQTYQLKLVRRSSSYDAALLQFVAPPPNLSVLPLRAAPARNGEAVYVLGYPLGFPSTHIVDAVVSASDASAITSNMLIDHGNSGGPMVDTQGCVIGMAYSNLNSQADEPVYSIKFAVPVSSLGDLLPPRSNAIVATTAPASGNVIHVSDLLSRTQDIHELAETVLAYHDQINARPGYVIEAVEGVGHQSLNPTELQYPTPVISPDGRFMTFDYSLSSGPFYDRRRSWIDMVVNTRQRSDGAGTTTSLNPSQLCR